MTIINSIDLNNTELVNFILCFRTEIEDAIYGKFSKEIRDSNLKAVRKNIYLDIKNKAGEIQEFKNLNKNSRQEFIEKMKVSFGLYQLIANSTENYSKNHLDNLFNSAWDQVLTQITRENVIFKNKRVDLRDLDQIREIKIDIDLLPQTHGSSLFQRGETQVLNVLTLGSSGAHQEFDGMEDFKPTFSRFFHHYNFPPYSVGETGRIGFTSRREIGHGALAQKAIKPVMPNELEFPYTIRLVSECLGSNGSTSMAATCSSTLSLMAGGVPIKEMISGVAMGLALDTKSEKFNVLTDIMGWEDHHGDMDFKVTGSKMGISALQLDNKVGGLTIEILEKALSKAKIGRLFILDKMEKVISKPRENISSNAPRMETLIVPMDKMRDVIGQGGNIINGMEAEFGVDIDLANETGFCSIFGTNSEMVDNCVKKIQCIIKIWQVGETIIGTVFRIETYGAFIKFDDFEGKESMVHISNLGNGKRLGKVEDVVNLNEKIEVYIKSINEKGQLDLVLIKVLK